MATYEELKNNADFIDRLMGQKLGISFVFRPEQNAVLAGNSISYPATVDVYEGVRLREPDCSRKFPEDKIHLRPQSHGTKLDTHYAKSFYDSLEDIGIINKNDGTYPITYHENHFSIDTDTAVKLADFLREGPEKVTLLQDILQQKLKTQNIEVKSTGSAIS